MGRAPAFQFYPADWLSDPQLRLASPSTKGIWIDLLCYMWKSNERGKLNGTVDQLCRMTGSNCTEMAMFINEANFLKFADVTICNDDVTVCNRRMMREEKERESTRSRVKRFRNADEKRLGNEEVTPPSSSSSSSSCTKVHYSANDEGFIGITKNDLELWSKAYPAINLQTEISKAAAWVRANPKNKKSNWERFLVNWFVRAQDKAPPARQSISLPVIKPKEYIPDDMPQISEADRRGNLERVGKLLENIGGKMT